MIEGLTDSTVLLRLAYQAMRRANLPAEQVFLEAGVNLEKANSKARTPIGAQDVFWQAAERITGDADIGLHIGEYLPLYRGQILEYLFMSSASFGEGLQRVIAYQRLVSDALNAKLVHNEKDCYIENMISEPLTKIKHYRHFTEAFLAGLIRFFKFTTEGKFVPTGIEVNYRTGADSVEYNRVFECPVILGQRTTRIHFDPNLLDFPLWQAEPEMLVVHERLAFAKMQELARLDLINEVNRVIAAHLESGLLSLEFVAQQINMPVRRLRSQLSDAETSFQQLLTEYRCRLAKRLLARTNESIERIVYLTGFADTSTFYRSFKRWTGHTPLEYRKHRQPFINKSKGIHPLHQA